MTRHVVSPVNNSSLKLLTKCENGTSVTCKLEQNDYHRIMRKFDINYD